jgi:chemotaxis protein CheD
VLHVVGVADMKIASEQGDELITYALGSCLGITIYDPVVHVGGMLHVMLPQSIIDPKRAAENPYTFVDTGVPNLFLDCYKQGAQKQRLIVKVAGGAAINGDARKDRFQIGKRNFIMLRKLLWKNGVLIKTHNVGGTFSRTMTLKIDTGDVTLKIRGETTTL